MSSYDNESLYNALSELEVIEKNQLDGALAQSRQENVSLEDVLVEKDLISDENIGKTISELLSLPFIKLSDISIPTEILNLVPEVVAKKQKVIAFGKDKNGLSIAMSDPGNLQIKDFIEKKVGIPVIVYYATKRDVNNALYLYNKDLSSTFDEIIKENVRQASSASGKQADPPITKIVDAILHFAYQNKASDVHIEPEKGKSLMVGNQEARQFNRGIIKREANNTQGISTLVQRGDDMLVFESFIQSEEGKNIYNEILNTVVFGQKKEDSKQAEILLTNSYTNPTFGYSIKIPESWKEPQSSDNQKSFRFYTDKKQPSGI